MKTKQGIPWWKTTVSFWQTFAKPKRIHHFSEKETTKQSLTPFRSVCVIHRPFHRKARKTIAIDLKFTLFFRPKKRWDFQTAMLCCLFIWLFFRWKIVFFVNRKKAVYTQKDVTGKDEWKRKCIHAVPVKMCEACSHIRNIFSTLFKTRLD